MQILKVIRDADIGSDSPAATVYKERQASRGIVFDAENKVALFHATKNHYHKLPGGGIEKGEDPITALRRELKEEIGCEVDQIREFGMIEEYRNKLKLHQISYCYITRVAGEKGIPHLEKGEIAEGFMTEWVELKAAIRILGEEHTDDYLGKYMRLRDLTFLKKAHDVSNGRI